MGLRHCIRRKLIVPITGFLKQGITPEKIALSIAWGIMIGIFPVVGATTLLCALAAVILRLNPAIIQLANWLAYPLQLLLIAPFFLAGAYMFGGEPLTQDVQELIVLLKSDLWSAVFLLKGIILHAVVVWLLAAPVGIVVLYWVLKPLLKMLHGQVYPEDHRP